MPVLGEEEEAVELTIKWAKSLDTIKDQLHHQQSEAGRGKYPPSLCHGHGLVPAGCSALSSGSLAVRPCTDFILIVFHLLRGLYFNW